MKPKKLASKLSADEKKKILEACDTALKWLDTNQTAEKDEFEHKLKDVEKVCTPIITKLYQGGAPPGGMPGGMPGGAGPAPGGSAGGPTIEEVD